MKIIETKLIIPKYLNDYKSVFESTYNKPFDNVAFILVDQDSSTFSVETHQRVATAMGSEYGLPVRITVVGGTRLKVQGAGAAKNHYIAFIG